MLISGAIAAFVPADFLRRALPRRQAGGFLVVGPAVDVKLIALQVGTFGRAFALRFAPLTFAVALGCGVVSGWLLVGSG